MPSVDRGPHNPRGQVIFYDPKTDIREFARETVNLSLAYGLTRYMDMAVMLPVYIDWLDNVRNGGGDLVDLYNVKGGITEGVIADVGDIEISLKFQYPPYPHRDFFKMAYYGAVTVPMGSKRDGWFPRHNNYLDKRADLDFTYAQNVVPQNLGFVDNIGVHHFYTSASPEIDMKMLWTWDFREMSDFFPVLFHINYGLRWMTNGVNEHVFYLNSGLEVRPANWLSIFADFSSEPRFGSIQQQESFVLEGFRPSDLQPEEPNPVIPTPWNRGLKNDPLRISPGLAFLTPVGLTFTAGVDISLANKGGVYYGNMSTAETGSGREQGTIIETGVEPKVALAASIGWNGLTVKRHAPISVPIPEPEPVRDTIRIIDTVFVDRFITDTLKVEVAAKPAPVRTFTITASVAAGQGTITPFGVNTVNEGAVVSYAFTPAAGFSIEQVTVNGINQGPLAQHTFINVRENQIITVSFREDPRPVVIEVAPTPTPVAVEIPREGLILRGVNFQTGSARLTPSSYDALDAVIRSLRDWPEVRLEIQGHTDATGARNTNMRLSRDRANSVMNYFIQQGVPAERLRAVGYGPDVPIADNDTPSGRELNRRVELKRFD